MSRKINHIYFTSSIYATEYIYKHYNEIDKVISLSLLMINSPSYIVHYINGDIVHIHIRKVKDEMNNEYDETATIIDDHDKAKSILDKWEVKLKSKLNYNNFDMAVIAKGKDLECMGCIYALRLMTQPPCSECKKSQHLYFTKENPMDWPDFKNCYNCKHRNKLVTEEPCCTCLSRDNERTCWEFNGR